MGTSATLSESDVSRRFSKSLVARSCSTALVMPQWRRCIADDSRTDLDVVRKHISPNCHARNMLGLCSFQSLLFTFLLPLENRFSTCICP